MAFSLGDEPLEIEISTDKIKILTSEIENKKDVYLFFSFDLVNSTKFKIEEKTKKIWPYVIHKFYEMILFEIQNEIPQVNVWKYLGDEILLYVSLSEINCIYTAPEIVYKVQKKVTTDLQETFNELINYHLDVKSTIWIAGTIETQSKQFNKKEFVATNEIYSNLKISLPLKDILTTDFIGPDMDIGFRVAKFAYHHKVVVSADLAYLLFKMKKPKGIKSIVNNLKIVSFEQLKGVWDGKYYPIIWYYPDWQCIEKELYYADHKTNPLVENILENRTYQVSELERIFEELGTITRVEELADACIKLFPEKGMETSIVDIS